MCFVPVLILLGCRRRGLPRETARGRRGADARGSAPQLLNSGYSVHDDGVIVLFMVIWMSRLSVVAACLVVACGATVPEAGRKHGSTITTANPTLLGYSTANTKPCSRPTEAELAHDLVPGIPCSISLTRYAGLPFHPGEKRVGHAELHSPSLLRQLTSEFNELPQSFPGTINCPNDRGSEIVGDLSYPHGERRRLTVTLTGCAGVRRETVGRSALGRLGERLIGRLERLTAHRS
jgi:hypothetical protein